MTMTIKTDVLVIGGGAAGIRAAIEARQSGCQVTILSNSGIGRANNTAISFGGFAAALDRDNPEQHFEDTMKGGYHLNQQALVRCLTEQVPAEVMNLEKMGVHTIVHYPGPIYMQKAYQNLKKKNTCPVSEKLAKSVLSLPLYPEIREEDVLYASEAINSFKG